MIKKGHGLKVGDKVEYEGVLRSVCAQGPAGYHVSLPDGNKSGVNALKEMLQTNTVLQALDLSSNELSKRDASILADGLSTNGALTSLNISSNRLGGYYDASYDWISDLSGVAALAAALPECR